MAHLGKKHIDSLDAKQMTLSMHSEKSQRCHHCSSDVEATALNDPLKSTCKSFANLLIILIQWLRGVQLRMVTIDEW